MEASHRRNQTSNHLLRHFVLDLCCFNSLIQQSLLIYNFKEEIQRINSQDRSFLVDRQKSARIKWRAKLRLWDPSLAAH